MCLRGKRRFLFLLVLCCINGKVYYRGKWEVKPLACCDKLPSSVISRVNDITGALQGVKFYVHDFVQGVSLDPLLEARYRDERLFFAVWDEEDEEIRVL